MSAAFVAHDAWRLTVMMTVIDVGLRCAILSTVALTKFPFGGNMLLKSFNDCSLAYLAKTFGLKRLLHGPDMQAWLNQSAELTTREKENLSDLQQLLEFNILGWNEQELALHFIGPVFSLVKFSTERFNLFAERYIEAIVDEIKLSGKPDGLIATGYFEPEKPFFCFHEYKKEIDNAGDPMGQVQIGRASCRERV